MDQRGAQRSKKSDLLGVPQPFTIPMQFLSIQRLLRDVTRKDDDACDPTVLIENRVKRMLQHKAVALIGEMGRLPLLGDFGQLGV